MALSEQQKQEILEQQKQSNTTKRVTSPELEKILYEAIPVLDHGFVRVVDYMGDDSSIVQAARVSYGKGTKKVSTDSGLIKYLMRHRHSTPFEMCEIKYHVKLPIFVARQWIRHRTANVNEYSARYSILEDEFYIPKITNLADQSSYNKQGRGRTLDKKLAKKVIKILLEDSKKCYDNYTWMLNEKNSKKYDEDRLSLSRELARINLTLNTYTEWYWKIDLHNFMHFVSLRADDHSQFEIRAYADTLQKILKSWVPMTYKAFVSYRLKSAELSKEAIEVIKSLIKGKKIKPEQSNLSKREWDELFNLIS